MLIPYWPDRKVEITWWRVKRRNNKVTMMITPLYRDKELGKHCKGDWFYQKWWFIDLPF